MVGQSEVHMVKKILFFLLLGCILAYAAGAKADVVTEFGWGIKAPNTSVVLQPRCQQVQLFGDIRTNPNSPHWGRRHASCGGNNPAFIGWPVAWESKWLGRHKAFRLRGGWFHYSNWFDGGNYLNGGDDHETHMDLAAFTITYNWTHLWRRNSGN